MNQPKEKLPKSVKEFHTIIEKVNTSLAKRNVELIARPIHALGEFSKLFKIDVPITPLTEVAIPNKYYGDSLSNHIYKWYEDRYGDRLKTDFRLGESIVLIRDEPWKIFLPLVYGNYIVVAESNTDLFPTDQILVNQQLYLNVFNYIEKIPKSLINTLNTNEKIDLMQQFQFIMNVIYLLDFLRRKKYIPEAIANLQTAVNGIFTRPMQLGHSKWSSLLFVEKVIKCYLQLNNITFPNIHELEKLINLDKSNQLTLINFDDISIIQCRASVNYGEIRVNINDAVSAHLASHKVVQVVSTAIKKKIIADK